MAGEPADLPVEREFDVVVVGSGAGGLAAAVTARHHGLDVLVVEKEAVLGGTTARSGGWLWIPGNRHARAEGVEDDRAQVLAYLRQQAGNHFDPARVAAYLDHGPAMVEFFEDNTAVEFVSASFYPDYHPEVPGGRSGGRAIGTAPYDARALGPALRTLSPPLPELTLGGMMIAAGAEAMHVMRAGSNWASTVHVAKMMARHALAMITHGRPTRLTNGNALIGRLVQSALDLKIEIWRAAPARALILEAGRVAGIVVERDGQRITLQARRGVVLAAGGFSHDLALRARLYPHAQSPAGHWPPAGPGATGDGIRLAETAGGGIESGLPNAAAWVPVSRVPYRGGRIGANPHFMDRGKPGVIAVTRKGTRFTNEAGSYHDFVQGMFAACAGESEVACWLIADHAALRRYGLGMVRPAPFPLGRHLRSGYLIRGNTLDELAATTGIDATALAATIARWNAASRDGRDGDFARGTTAYHRLFGDRARKPNPCMGEIERAPFYAMRIVPGDIGTYAGLKADARARVLDAAGAAIPGLYAVGNDAITPFGGAYPGPGTMIGPAMVFGYIAGRTLAEQKE